MTAQTAAADLLLKPKEDRRIRAGHPWVFSNELAAHAGDLPAGTLVRVRAASGALLGVGYYNPASLIAVRMLASGEPRVDADFFRARLVRAFGLRDRLADGNGACRLVHGESDLMPGLVVDRYCTTLAVQTFAAGMDLILPDLCDLLEQLLHPAAIIERNESPLRDLEKLPVRSGALRGTPGTVDVREAGILFRVDVLKGQKTGLFLDQRENRIGLRRYVAGARVLDCFCNDGGFALHAAAHGAASVVGVDISPEAVARATVNAGLNGAASARFEQGDAFEYLKAAENSGERFDVVILDPPSFTKSRKTVPAARKGYRELNARAMRILRQGGILVTSSCSHHILPGTFLDAIRDGATRSARELQLLEWRGAAPDHPVLPGVPETEYLKCAFLRVW